MWLYITVLRENRASNELYKQYIIDTFSMSASKIQMSLSLKFLEVKLNMFIYIYIG